MVTEFEGKFLSSTRRDPAFIAYWKEATTAFRKHQGSDCHKQAIELAVLSKQVGCHQDVGELLSAAHLQEKTNRAMFLKVLGCIKFWHYKAYRLEEMDQKVKAI